MPRLELSTVQASTWRPSVGMVEAVDVKLRVCPVPLHQLRHLGRRV
jgi:hypothetical protein